MSYLQLLAFVAVCAVASAGYIRSDYSGHGANYILSYDGGHEYHAPTSYSHVYEKGHNYLAPARYNYVYDKGHNYHAYPKYKFDYSVSDPHTGDHKTQWETRDGDVVKGAYSLLEADGTTRIVEYTADKNGFHPVVKRIGQAYHPQVHYKPHGYGDYYTYH